MHILFAPKHFEVVRRKHTAIAAVPQLDHLHQIPSILRVPSDESMSSICAFQSQQGTSMRRDGHRDLRVRYDQMLTTPNLSASTCPIAQELDTKNFANVRSSCINYCCFWIEVEERYISFSCKHKSGIIKAILSLTNLTVSMFMSNIKRRKFF